VSALLPEPSVAVTVTSYTPGGVGACTTTLAVAALEGSAWALALTTTGTLGNAAGALYSPEELIVPIVELPPIVPFTSHETCELEGLIVAVNCCDADVRTKAEVGLTESDTGKGGRGGGLPPPPPPPPHEINKIDSARGKSRSAECFLKRDRLSAPPMSIPAMPMQSARKRTPSIDMSADGLDSIVEIVSPTLVAGAPAATLGGLKLHDACGGRFKHAKLTGAWKLPAIGVMLRLYLAGCPAATV
jgi:hypothetical protein